MKYIASILVLVFGLIYWPLNTFYMFVQKWYFREREKDEVIRYAFLALYWILAGFVFLVSYPYEWMTKFAAH